MHLLQGSYTLLTVLGSQGCWLIQNSALRVADDCLVLYGTVIVSNNTNSAEFRKMCQDSVLEDLGCKSLTFLAAQVVSSHQSAVNCAQLCGQCGIMETRISKAEHGNVALHFSILADDFNCALLRRSSLKVSQASCCVSFSVAWDYRNAIRKQSMGQEKLPPPLVFNNVVLTTVEPLERTAHVEKIDPTDTDMLPVDSYLGTLFAYRLADSSDVLYVEMVNRVKEGLRKVLVPFFPWAGRWVAVPGGKGRQLLCNDKGIPFIEASVDKDLYSAVQFSAKFRPVPELQGYCVLGMKEENFRQQMLPDGLPCAFVQVTRFRCGGLVFGVTFNHMLADGRSLMHFMTAWSDFSRTDKTDMILDHNRAAIAGSTGSLPSHTFANVPTTNAWKTRSYEVNASVIESLKEEVKRSADGAYVSTMDCIYAHMWKTVSSLPFSIIGGKEIGILNSVDGRTKFYDPPVPNLLGNVLTNMRAPKIPTAELLNTPLSVIASKIRDKINTTSRETWLSPERVGEAMDAFLNDNTLPWGQTCWSSFPMYETDFGFGSPIFTPGLNTVGSSAMLGMNYVGPPTPGVSSSAAFMQVLSTPRVLEALEQHPDFLPFFLPRKSENYS